jgi:acyl-coenzyme A synthetase/AMP-(fatty) acid ligase
MNVTERWRDTGDDVRVVNGKIYFVGRSDFVVKIYGKRVNPVEVATTLKSSPLFSDVVYSQIVIFMIVCIVIIHLVFCFYSFVC